MLTRTGTIEATSVSVATPAATRWAKYCLQSPALWLVRAKKRELTSTGVAPKSSVLARWSRLASSGPALPPLSGRVRALWSAVSDAGSSLRSSSNSTKKRTACFWSPSYRLLGESGA